MKYQTKRNKNKIQINLFRRNKTFSYQCGDAVLDVEHIARYGKKIGCQVTEVTIVDGLHDLVLSRPDVRDEAYRAMYNWLSEQQLLP